MKHTLKRLNTRHRALMLSMVTHPHMSNVELSKECGFHTQNIIILKNSDLFMDALHKLQDELDEKELKNKAVRDGVGSDPVRRIAIDNSKKAINGIVTDMYSEDVRVAHTAKLDVLKIAGYDINKPADTKIINTNINVSSDAAKQMELSRAALDNATEKYKKDRK